MSLFHLHRWREQSRHVIAPIGSATMQGSFDTVEKLLSGRTIVVLECEKCHDLKSVEVLGQAKK